MLRLDDLDKKLNFKNKDDPLLFIKHNETLIEMRFNRKNKMNSFNDEMG